MFRAVRRAWQRQHPLTAHFYNRFLHKYFAHDVGFELQLLARREAARYARQKMAEANMFADRWRLLQAAIDDAGTDGLFLELGVEKGASANFIAHRIGTGKEPAILHAFDSFEGLPERWQGTFETGGKFSTGGRIPRLRANVAVHKGWFADTLPDFCRDHGAAAIALIHIDCDIYSSTRTVLTQLGELLRPGSIVVFDEYFNYHGWQNHEFKAWQEFVAARRVKYTYRGFCARGGQVFLRIDEIAAGRAGPERGQRASDG
jgi:predicted O-methyltransferase YrrM